MIREVSQFEYECDVCKFVLIEGRTIRNKHQLPEGWSTVMIHNCGMTGYSKELLRCARCTREDAR